MAILRGFPPSNTISPSVRITEKDLSFIAPDQSFHRAGLVGFASKGPINVPTLVQSRRQLNTVFGYPHPEAGDPYLMYAAEQYLLVASELYVVRVADTDAVSWERARTAQTQLPSAGGAILLVSSGPGPYSLDKDMYFRWRLNKVLASKTLVALADENHPDPVVQGQGYSASQLADDLNMQLDPSVDGIEFFATDESVKFVEAEVKSTSDTDNSAVFNLNNNNLVAGSITGRVVVGGAVVQTFSVNDEGVFTFKTVVSSVVKAVSGSVDLGLGRITIGYNGNLSVGTNNITVDYNYTASYGTSRLGVRTTFSFGPDASLELVSVKDALYGPDTADVGSNVHVSPVGLGTEMEVAQFTGGDSGSQRSVTFQDTGDTVTLTNHGFVNGTQISFSAITNTTGITVNTSYFVVNASADTFKLSLTSGGAALALTTNGVGTGIAAGLYDFTTVSAYDLQVVLDGTDSVLVDNVVQVLDLSSFANNPNASAAAVVASINSQIAAGDVPGGFEAVTVGNFVSLRTLHAGNDARLLVKNESSVFGLFGFDAPLVGPNSPNSGTGPYVTAEGYSPDGVSGSVGISTYGVVRGNSNRLGDVSVTLAADSAGIDGNATQVVVKNNVREGNFVIEVYSNGVQVESWGNLTKDEASRFYVETFLSLVSDYVRALDNTANPSPPLDGTYQLSGGSDGIPSDPDDQDYYLIGNQLGYTGIYALSEPEQIDIDLIAVPGHSSTGVIMALIDMCQNLRMDCMAIVDAPFGLTVKEIIHWQNGAHPLNTTRFDSDFAALYWPWVKIRDTFNNVDVWVPPSGSVMAVYARNDALAAPWFAPAGVTRGIVPGITDVFSRPTLEERDLMYGNRNAINPIVQYADFQDFVVWGQKTLQRKPTALDRVNVRRLMFVIEKRIRQASRALLFEPHDEIFREKFIDIATRILREVQIGRGLTAFIIKADEELNTPDVIDRNEFRARIGVQPTRAVEFMFLEFSIHRTGSFEAGSDTF